MQFVSLCLPHFSSYEVNVPFFLLLLFFYVRLLVSGVYFVFWGVGGWRDLFSFCFSFVFLFCLFVFNPRCVTNKHDSDKF